MKRVRPQSAAFSRSMQGADIFGADDASAAAAATAAQLSVSRKAALSAAFGHGGVVAIAEDAVAGDDAASPPGHVAAAAVSDAKLREVAGSDIFADQSARKHKPAGRAHVKPATEGNKLFAEDDTDPAAIKFGNKGVSDALKASLKSSVFDEVGDDMMKTRSNLFFFLPSLP